jgi:hypothetical protein
MAPFLLSEAIGPSSGERRRSQSILQSGRDPSSKLTGGNVRVVVTGGAGYIGSTAVARLVARGDDVVAIDNLTQGHQQALPDSVPLVPIDICDRSAIASALHEHRPDAVLHFAALTIAPESVRDPAPYWRVNTGGTLNVLDATALPSRSRFPKTHRSSRSIHTEPRSLPPNAPSRPMRRRIALPMPHCVISTSPVRPVRSAKTTDRKPTSSQVRSTPRQAGEIRSPYSVPTSQLPTERPFAITSTLRT